MHPGAINMMDHEVIFDRVGRRIGFYPRECSISSTSVSDASASASASASSASAFGLANLSASSPLLGSDPCGELAAPGLLLRLRLAAARTLHARSPLVDKLALVVLGVLLSLCCLEARRRVQEWRERLASGAKATRRHWRSQRYAGVGEAGGAEGRSGLVMVEEMEVELEEMDMEGRSGDGAAPLAPSVRSCGLSFARPTDEALPNEGALPVSDEDETSSEHCLIAR